jgi:3-oxoacyl-[acyl-carrier protein] reductase
LAGVRSALVTGSSRGIGLGIAQRLATQGHALTIAGRDRQRLSDVASTLRGAGAPEVVVAAGDILDDGYLAELVSIHQTQFATLDTLIINAGAGSSGLLADFHLKRFDKQIAVNLRSAFIIIQTALPLLRVAAAANPNVGAKVVALASITGIYAEAELAAYGAAKAGLMSLCRSVNLEENQHGVAATAIAPGYVDTDMAQHIHDVIPAERMIRISDVVEVVDACLRMSRWAIVPEIVIARSGSTGVCA